MDVVNHFDQNRPVHLARRDVFFEHVVDMLEVQQEAIEPADRVGEFEKVLFLLEIARRHARFAVRSHAANPKDREFCKLIELLVGNIKAILSMLRLKDSVEHSEGFFYSFLGINHASVALQAEEYGRRANDILRCVLNTLKLAEEPFLELKKANHEEASPAEQLRYQKAHEHFTTLVADQSANCCSIDEMVGNETLLAMDV